MAKWLPRGWVVAALAASLLLAAPTSAFAERTLGLSSGSFRYSLAAGESISGELEAINDGNQPFSVKVYAASQSFDSSGTVSFSVPTTQDNPLTSPASWVSVDLPPGSKSVANTPFVELAVGDRIPVNFEVVVPPGVAPGDHSIILFFEIFDPANPAASGAAVQGRIGARIKLRVDGAVVQKVTLEPFEIPAFVVGGNVGYRTLISNMGNIDETMTVSIAALDRNDAVVTQSMLLTDTVIYAKTRIPSEGVLVLGSGAFGTQRVRLTGVYGQLGADAVPVPTEIIEERNVLVVPLWVIIALGVLIAVAVLLIGRAAILSRIRRHDVRSRRTSGSMTDEYEE